LIRDYRSYEPAMDSRSVCFLLFLLACRFNLTFYDGVMESWVMECGVFCTVASTKQDSYNQRRSIMMKI